MMHVASSSPELTLVQLLEVKAREEGLTNQELSERVGIDHATWSRVRRGLGTFSAATLGRIVRAYPDLERATLHYLCERGDGLPVGPTLSLLDSADDN